MQFFVVSIVFLFVYLHISKALSYVLQVCTILMSITYVFVMYYINEFHINGNYDDMLSPKGTDIYLKMYIKPWARVSPYVLGLLAGILYFRYN